MTHEKDITSFRSNYPTLAAMIHLETWPSQVEDGVASVRRRPENSNTVRPVLARVGTEGHGVVGSEVGCASPERRPAALVVRIAIRVRAVILCCMAVSELCWGPSIEHHALK